MWMLRGAMWMLIKGHSVDVTGHSVVVNNVIVPWVPFILHTGLRPSTYPPYYYTPAIIYLLQLDAGAVT